MSIFKYLQESLIAEKLPLKTARHYVKKGKENVKNLPDEFKEAYDKMFGKKSRIQIGTIKVEGESKSMADKDNTYNMHEINTFMRKNINTDISKDKNLMLDVVIDKINPENPKYVILNITSSEAKKELQQAYDPSKGYLLKTVIKKLKKYIAKDKHNELSQKIGQILTKVSNISTVDQSPIILSRHSYDVAGMSTSKRWQSCKSIEGCYSHFLDTEVGHLLIAFVANPDRKGKDLLNDPYARLLVLPVTGNKGYGLYVSTDVYKYGGKFDDFHSIVENYVSNFMPIYSDSDEKETVGEYYKDSGFEDENVRWRIVDNEIAEVINTIEYSPREFDNIFTRYVYDKMETVGDYDIDNIISDVIITEIDKLFRWLNDIGDNDLVMSFYDYNFDMYVEHDAMSTFIEMIDNYSIHQIIQEFITFNFLHMNNALMFYRAEKLSIIDIDSYLDDVINNNGITDASEYQEFFDTIYEYITDNTYDVDKDTKKSVLDKLDELEFNSEEE